MAPRIPRRDLIKAAAAAPALTFTLTQRAEVAPTLPATPAARPADLILKRGKIITVDRAFTIAEAIAIAGERILAVGREPRDRAPFRAVDPRHRSQWPQRYSRSDRWACPSGSRGAQARLSSAWARALHPRYSGSDRGARSQSRPGEWIVTMPIGDPPYYFDVPDILAEQRWPTRHELDAAAPEQPGLHPRHTGDSGGTAFRWCPAPTARRCGAPASREIPFHLSTSLRIEKDANGDPTGVFVENEMQPIAELIYFRNAAGFTRADRARALPYVGAGLPCPRDHQHLRGARRGDRTRCAPTRTRSATASSDARDPGFSPDWKAVGNAPLAPSSKRGPDGSANLRSATIGSRSADFT